MKTKNERFTDIRLSLKPMSQTRFSEILGVSLSTVQKIEQGTGEVTDYVQEQLESKCNVNLVYINTGKGNKFIDNIVPSFKEVKPVNDSTLLQMAFDKLNDQLDKKDAVINNLIGIIQNLGGGNSKVNFLKAFRENGTPKVSLEAKAA